MDKLGARHPCTPRGGFLALEHQRRPPMTTFQIKLSSEDRLVTPGREAPDDVVATSDAKQVVGGSSGEPSTSVDRHGKG